MRSARQRQHWWWWALMGIGALMVVFMSASKAPTEGVGEDRLFAIAGQLKCVQCVGESVANSSAPIAVQFRTEIRDQMAAGRTNDEILNFFAYRYDDVLLNPPSRGIGALVWVIPVVAVFTAGFALVVAMRNWSRDRVDRSATEEEQRIVSAAMHEDRGAP